MAFTNPFSPQQWGANFNRGLGGARNHSPNESFDLTSFVKFYKNTVVMDEMDKDIYKAAILQSEILKDSAKRLTKEGFKNYNHLQEDAYSALFKVKVTLRNPQQIDHEHIINHSVLEAAMQTSGYRELRGLTMGDDLASVTGTEHLVEILEKILKDKKKELEKEQQEAEKAQKQLQEMLAQMEKDGEGKGKKGKKPGKGDEEGEGEGEGEPGEGDGQGNSKKGKGGLPPKPTLTLEQAMARAEQARQALRKKVISAVLPTLTDSLKQVNAEVKKYSELLQQWGLSASDTVSRMPAQKRIELINRIKNSSKLRKIAELLGKYKPIASSLEKEKVKNIPMRVQKITNGDNISRTIPADIALHSNPATRPLFYKKFLEKQLRQVHYDGHKTLGKGPIVLCLDESGSMSGSPEEWGKALGLTVLDMAKNQNRDFVFIHFDARDAKDLQCDEYLKDEPVDPGRVISTAEHFYCGGTSFEDPLDRARTYIDKHAAFSKADIIFITDGECGVGQPWLTEFMKWKTEKKIRILSVLIDSGYHSDSMLNKFSDTVTPLANLQSDGDSVATNIFANLV